MTARRLALMTSLVLAGLSAGFFFAFEASVTRALAEVDDTTYIVTFQAINDTIRNAAFGIVFFGTIPAIAVALALHRHSPSSVRWLIGGALGLFIVVIGITAAGNVPLNDALADVTDPTGPTAGSARADFETDWNRLNLIRTLTAAAGFGVLVITAMLSSVGERGIDAADGDRSTMSRSEPASASASGPS